MRYLLSILVCFFCITSANSAYIIDFESVAKVTVEGVRYDLIKWIYSNNDIDYSADVIPLNDGGAEHYSGTVEIKSYVTYNDVKYKVERIGESAFRGCVNLEELIIPNTVQTIGDYALAECGTLKVSISENMRGVGKYAFNGTTLCGNINLTQVIDFYNWALCGANLKSITVGPWETECEYASLGSFFLMDSDIEEINFLEQEQEIVMPVHTFANCNIKELKLPKGSKIAEEIVYNCPKIERVIFPDTDRLLYITNFQNYSEVETFVTETGCIIAKSPNVKEVIALSATPAKFYWHSSEYNNVRIIDDHSQCVLKVPQGSEDLYRADPIWGRFERIEGFAPGEYTGISEAPVAEVEYEATPVYYNLQGMQVKEPVKGQLYIRRTGAKTAKIVY